MGRAKLKMELISGERKRNKAFKRRRDGLISKIHELTTLCDVTACMIIYYPKQEKGGADSPPVVWPKCPDEVQRILEAYKEKEKESGSKKYGLKDFFGEKTKKVEEELAKLRKQNLESRYPAPTEIIDKLSEVQLRDFAGKLKEKAGFIRSRAQMLKMIMANQSSSHNFYNPASVKQEQFINQQNFPVPVNNDLSYNYYNQHQDLINQNSMKSEIDCCTQFWGEVVDPNPQFNRQVPFGTLEMQWAKLNQNAMRNQNDLYSQFGGEISNASPQFSRQVFCDETGKQWVVDPMVCEVAVPLDWYCEHMQRQAPSSSTASWVAPPPQQQLQTMVREDGFGSGQDEEYLRQQIEMMISRGKMH